MSEQFIDDQVRLYVRILMDGYTKEGRTAGTWWLKQASRMSRVAFSHLRR